VVPTEDGMIIEGGRPLHGARVSSFGDHRVAMACAVAGMFASGETVIEDTGCIETSYPGFAEVLAGVLKPGQRDSVPVITSLHPRETEGG
jgi:3-phosphoshikimate 1-carboxyvinyltransferase